MKDILDKPWGEEVSEGATPLKRAHDESVAEALEWLKQLKCEKCGSDVIEVRIIGSNNPLNAYVSNVSEYVGVVINQKLKVEIVCKNKSCLNGEKKLSQQ